MADVLPVEKNSIRPRLWRWIIGTLFIITIWISLGYVLSLISANFFGYDLDLLLSTNDEDLAKVRELPVWSTSMTVLIEFLALFVATLLAYRIFLGRRVIGLFTSFEKLSWRRIWIGFLAMLTIVLSYTFPSLIIYRDDYTWSWSATEFLPFLFISLTFLPIQTTAEELFFRGWIQQWLDNGKKKQWTISLLSSLLFAAPHLLNSEVAGNELLFPVLAYGSVGFMFAWVTHRDKTLEVAIGAHFANNLSLLLVSSDDSALPFVSLYTTPEVSLAPTAAIALLTVPLFIWLTKKWSTKV